MLSSFAFPDPPTRAAKAALKKKTREDDPALHSLTDLVNRLGAQLDKLESISTVEEEPHEEEAKRDDSASNYKPATAMAPHEQQHPVDPFSMEVLESYEKLLQQEPLLHKQHHCCCCSATTPGTVTAAPGIPWPLPQQPCRELSTDEDPLQAAYTHWCTLMRCLPLMAPSAQTHVRVIGLYAMRQLLQAMDARRCTSTATLTSNGHKSTTRCTTATCSTSVASPRQQSYNNTSATLQAANNNNNNGPHQATSLTLAPLSSSSLLKNSSSCLNIYAHTDATRKKADAWIPHIRDQRTTPSSIPSSPPPPAPQPSSASSMHHYYSTTTATTPPNATSSSSSSDHHRRHAKLRKWFFKRNNRVAPQSF
ncbi:hypothetical protein O0I10_005804 [Lichtheimia ornata]|uniref:Uncharacterized protein n=1 Tax=Lichtheimia ornata TaxID=688661 RepID=A0AAD7V6C8_9FUNG|nr:uncharacterized protein O0I10_005804 [Lichtheimia ornata]KAJ8658451.1 hypothetical protein O0I10_005804 [Lichtheimia ornata]